MVAQADALLLVICVDGRKFTCGSDVKNWQSLVKFREPLRFSAGQYALSQHDVTNLLFVDACKANYVYLDATLVLRRKVR